MRGETGNRKTKSALQQLKGSARKTTERKKEMEAASSEGEYSGGGVRTRQGAQEPMTGRDSCAAASSVSCGLDDKRAGARRHQAGNVFVLHFQLHAHTDKQTNNQIRKFRTNRRQENSE
jgi:hypothetical protein